MTDQLVTAVFKPCDTAAAAIEPGRVSELLTRSGAANADLRFDERTRAVHVTFTSVGDPAPTVARLRRDLAGEWTFVGEASYAIPTAEGGTPARSKWPMALAALAAGLAALRLRRRPS
jgi:MYXO-CTERM domain-containing protein